MQKHLEPTPSPSALSTQKEETLTKNKPSPTEMSTPKEEMHEADTLGQ